MGSSPKEHDNVSGYRSHDRAARAHPSALHPAGAFKRCRGGVRQRGGDRPDAMKAEATARLRLRVGAYEHHRHRPAYLERATAALRGADERPRRMIVHATIIGTAAAAAIGAVLFGV